MKKSRPADDDESCFSPLSCLPDDVVLEILNKVMDLKTLCVCQVVSKRFYEIVRQVNSTICYTTLFPSIVESLPCNSFYCAVWSIKKFNRVKSLCIRCPSSTQASITVNNNNDDILYKWKVKMGKNIIDSFVFLSPSSIYDKKNGLVLYEEKQNMELLSKFKIAMRCLPEACLRVNVLRLISVRVPSLEKISITDPDNREMISVNGRENIDEMRKWNGARRPDRFLHCFVPLLELPVSGYVMKGVTLFLVDCNDVPKNGNYDRFINDEIDFKHDKEVAAYHEAMMEIFKKHRGSIKTLL